MPVVKNTETGVVCGVTDAAWKTLKAEKSDSGKERFILYTPPPPPKPKRTTQASKPKTTRKRTTSTS